MSRDVLIHKMREEKSFNACQCIHCKRPGQNKRLTRLMRRKLKIELQKDVAHEQN